MGSSSAMNDAGGTDELWSPLRSESSTSTSTAMSATVTPTVRVGVTCQVCLKSFNNSSALAKHKLTHSDERRYVCSICTKTFKRQDHLYVDVNNFV